MPDTDVEDIIGLCLLLDMFARDTYYAIGKDLATRRDTRELALFWDKLAAEEEDHVRFWRALEEVARREGIPDLFDDAPAMKRDLESLRGEVAELCLEARRPHDLGHAIMATYTLEFYMLHPALSKFFDYAQVIGMHENPKASYDAHISGILDKLAPLSEQTPVVGLLGKALREMWHRNKVLSEEAVLDRLTGLLNRRGFERLAHTLAFLAGRWGWTVGAIMADIDRFKDVNETRGHLFADRILTDVASGIASCVRQSDLVGRFGGDEFLVVLPAIEPDALQAISEKIETCVAALEWDGVKVSLSLGTAAGPISEMSPAEDLWALVHQADHALVGRKARGRV
jgi:diguanylate cyclase (GGDEF)-like protein